MEIFNGPNINELWASKSVKGLIEALKDEDSGVRKTAAEALGEIGNAGATVPLIEALKDKNSRVRKTAAEALRKIKDANSINPLTDTKKSISSNAGRPKGMEMLAKVLVGWSIFVLVAILGGISYCAIVPGYMRNSGKAYPPLHTAAINGDLASVQRLVESGVSLDEKDFFRQTALEEALSKNQYGVAEYLIANGASVEGAALNIAISDGNLSIAKALVDRGAKADPQDLADYVAGLRYGERINLQLVDFYLTAGADINGLSRTTVDIAGDEASCTALGYAVYYRDFELVKYLVAKGADVNVETSRGSTPLELAKGSRRFVGGGKGWGPGVNYYSDVPASPEIIEFLRQHGAR